MSYTSKPCRKEDSIQITPEEEKNLDLKALTSKLEELGYEKKLATDNMAIVKKKHKITIFPSGRILIKNTQNEEEAEKIVEGILGIIDD